MWPKLPQNKAELNSRRFSSGSHDR